MMVRARSKIETPSTPSRSALLGWVRAVEAPSGFTLRRKGAKMPPLLVTQAHFEMIEGASRRGAPFAPLRLGVKQLDLANAPRFGSERKRLGVLGVSKSKGGVL
jgi:hypothetical protein